jgi:hypothetical protein
MTGRNAFGRQLECGLGCVFGGVCQDLGVTQSATPEKIEPDELDYELRGQLLRLAFGGRLSRMQFVGRSAEEIEKTVKNGRFTVLFDNNGKFIKNSFVPLLGGLKWKRIRTKDL